MKELIVVVGGYGQVGKTICRELGALYPGKVYAAGRNMDRADQFCRTTDGKVRPMKVDIKQKMNPEFWSSIKLIIMCMDQTDLSFVRACLESGTHYTDISADYSFLSKVEALHEHAVNNRATTVLNVGLSPGLTNLMARHAANLMDRTDAIDIALLLGLGDQHGKAGVEWIIDNLCLDFHVMKDGKPVGVAGFSDGKTTDFGTELGKWRAYRFNFSDQHSLWRTLDIPNVSTRICLDIRALNKGLAWLNATGLTKLLHVKRIRDATVHLFGNIRLGKETAAIKIDAWGKQEHEDTRIECFMQGSNESVITGKVAAFVGDMLYRSLYDHGVYHVEQLFDLESLLTWLDHTISIETRINGKVI